MGQQPIAWLVYTIDGTTGYFTSSEPTLREGQGAIALVALEAPKYPKQLH